MPPCFHLNFTLLRFEITTLLWGFVDTKVHLIGLYKSRGFEGFFVLSEILDPLFPVFEFVLGHHRFSASSWNKMACLVSRTGREFQRYNKMGCRQVAGLVHFLYAILLLFYWLISPCFSSLSAWRGKLGFVFLFISYFLFSYLFFVF